MIFSVLNSLTQCCVREIHLLHCLFCLLSRNQIIRDVLSMDLFNLVPYFLIILRQTTSSLLNNRHWVSSLHVLWHVTALPTILFITFFSLCFFSRYCLAATPRADYILSPIPDRWDGNHPEYRPHGETLPSSFYPFSLFRYTRAHYPSVL